MKGSLPATEDAVRSRQASPRPLRVVHTPFIAQNAYQPRLLEELRNLGIDARGAKRSILPLLRRRADAVHFHWIQHRWFGYRLARGMVCEAFFAQLRAMRAQGTRLVWTIHNLVPHECDDHDAELRLFARMCRSVDACIVHSQHARDAVIAAVDPQGRDESLSAGLGARLHVIPHGNYIGCYQPRLDRDAERARLGVSPDETLFAFVGQIREYKRVDTLIHAFRKANAPRTKLLVCGRPKGDAVARSLSEARGDDPRIKFELGFLPDDALASALLASDAVVLPYRDSLTSGAALLAMSYGRTVVAPNIGCFGELLGTGALGLYAAEGADSTEELARALVEVAARADSRVATGAAHLERARTFDWPTIARATAALYETA